MRARYVHNGAHMNESMKERYLLFMHHNLVLYLDYAFILIEYEHAFILWLCLYLLGESSLVMFIL